jgi:hypothetical protein
MFYDSFMMLHRCKYIAVRSENFHLSEKYNLTGVESSHEILYSTDRKKSFMPENVTNELLYEVLKSIQAQLTTVREDVGSIKGRMTNMLAEMSSISGRMDRL